MDPYHGVHHLRISLRLCPTLPLVLDLGILLMVPLGADHWHLWIEKAMNVVAL